MEEEKEAVKDLTGASAEIYTQPGWFPRLSC